MLHGTLRRMAPRKLPTGTQIVSRVAVQDDDAVMRDVGSVGVVFAITDEFEPAYRVQFPDGPAATYARDQLIVRAEAQWAPPLAYPGLGEHVILSSVIGSQAYGLATDTSDLDRRGA